MKKLLSFLLVLVMLFSLASCAGDKTDDKNNTTEPTVPTEPEEEIDYSKVIDIYLIAGQSNAVGCTMANTKQIYKDAPILKDGVPNVHYAGNSRDGSDKLINRDLPWQNVKSGLGLRAGYIGPEAGMAVALSEFYNEESGRNAGIIKFAHGGTSIHNVKSGLNSFGNWVSPSYAKSMNISYNDKEITGGLYRGLLEQVKRNISELKEYGGFTTVNIKGMYWMQGEADIWAGLNQYQNAFYFLATDLRRDLANIMLEFTDGKSDCGAKDMKIFIGSISSGFAITDANTEKNGNIPFINMQKQLARNTKNCVFVDNSQYAITRWNADKNTVEVLGSDKYHWNSKDMLAIGQNVGKLIIENCLTDKK